MHSISKETIQLITTCSKQEKHQPVESNVNTLRKWVRSKKWNFFQTKYYRILNTNKIILSFCLIVAQKSDHPAVHNLESLFFGYGGLNPFRYF